MLTLPEGETVLKEFEEEAEFYQIQGIIDELRSSEPSVQASKPTKPFEESEKKRKKKKKKAIDYSMSKELEHVHFSSTQTLENEDQPRNQVLTDAENYIKEACEMVQREATRLRLEQEAIDSMSKKLEHVHFSSTIKLNVGGHHFATCIQTLTKDPNSMLAAMFSGRFDIKPSEDGSFFIDRDGTHFRYILNYLRSGELILPEDATVFKEIEAEFKFYHIQGILNQMKLTFENSEIMTDEEHRRVLKGWLAPHKGEWRRLFRASRDGFAVKTFHTKCDNKGPTVSVIQSGNNIFGGFTEFSWKSPGKF